MPISKVHYEKKHKNLTLLYALIALTIMFFLAGIIKFKI